MSRAPLMPFAVLAVCLLVAATVILAGKRTPTEPVPGDHNRAGGGSTYSSGNSEPRTAGPQQHSGERVTFILTADKTCPDPPAPPDMPGPIGGEATITRVSRLTTVDPQGSSWSQSLLFPAQGEHRGTCTAELPKGWRYRVAFSNELYASDPIEFDVPDTTEVEIKAKLTLLQSLYVATERDGQGVAASVEVRDPNGITQFVGASDPYPYGGYRYWCGGLVPDGVWSVRAGAMNGAFSEWQDFQVDYSYIPRVVTVEVPAR